MTLRVRNVIQTNFYPWLRRPMVLPIISLLYIACTNADPYETPATNSLPINLGSISYQHGFGFSSSLSPSSFMVGRWWISHLLQPQPQHAPHVRPSFLRPFNNYKSRALGPSLQQRQNGLVHKRRSLRAWASLDPIDPRCRLLRRGVWLRPPRDLAPSIIRYSVHSSRLADNLGRDNVREFPLL